jgi:TetR/AcrR family transcriptional regulator, transcriptional repressor for nem operon
MGETATAIMDAAERRIREAGYTGFSFREIASDIGVKSASVHYHYPTKDALAASVARRYTDRFMSLIDDEIARGSNPVNAWTTIFRRALKNDGPMCLCGALGVASATLPQEVLVEVRRFFELGLERLRQHGFSRDQAVQLMASLEGGMLLSVVLSDPAILDVSTGAISAALGPQEKSAQQNSRRRKA